MKKIVDTIAALATPSGRGGVAIVRISGPLVISIAEKMLGKLPSPRFAQRVPFLDNLNQPIDEGIALFFPNPHSFTGEDILELQCHGGPAVIDSLLQTILKLGARLARPGEFSERAFLNDKMDLIQAEAIADLINASSLEAARSALRSLQGEFSKKIHSLVEELIQLRLYVEAAIDFVEEEINFLSSDHIKNLLTKIIFSLEEIEKTAFQGSLLREGITVVIAGEPNVGKSSLLNRLSGKDVAIVTDIPGTTRDILRDYIMIDGMPLHIIDTAGLRKSEDKVEQIGIQRAEDEISRADLVLWVVDARETSDVSLPEYLLSTGSKLITLRNKIDLTKEKPKVITEKAQTIISLSVKENLGIELLKDYIKKYVGLNTQSEGQFSARRRHLDALTRAKKFLLEGQYQLIERQAGELLAEDLRQAQLCLSEITGEFTSDDLLGRIFSSFCIGK